MRYTRAEIKELWSISPLYLKLVKKEHLHDETIQKKCVDLIKNHNKMSIGLVCYIVSIILITGLGIIMDIYLLMFIWLMFLLLLLFIDYLLACTLPRELLEFIPYAKKYVKEQGNRY